MPTGCPGYTSSTVETHTASPPERVAERNMTSGVYPEPADLDLAAWSKRFAMLHSEESEAASYLADPRTHDTCDES